MFEDEFKNHESSEAGLWDDWDASCWQEGDAGGFDLWPAGAKTGWRQCELPNVRVASALRHSLRTQAVSWRFSAPRRCPCLDLWPKASQ
jgi:hypothetical protein